MKTSSKDSEYALNTVIHRNLVDRAVDLNQQPILRNTARPIATNSVSKMTAVTSPISASRLYGKVDIQKVAEYTSSPQPSSLPLEFIPSPSPGSSSTSQPSSFPTSKNKPKKKDKFNTTSLTTVYVVQVSSITCFAFKVFYFASYNCIIIKNLQIDSVF